MRISDWSSDVCSSDLFQAVRIPERAGLQESVRERQPGVVVDAQQRDVPVAGHPAGPQRGRAALPLRSEEHTSELQSLMRISYAVFCLNTKNTNTEHQQQLQHTDNSNKHTQSST